VCVCVCVVCVCGMCLCVCVCVCVWGVFLCVCVWCVCVCVCVCGVCVKLGCASFTKGSTEGLILSSRSTSTSTILVFHLVDKCTTFYGIRRPLPYLQEATCRPTPEPNESTPYHQILSFKIHFNNINSSSHSLSSDLCPSNFRLKVIIILIIMFLKG